MLVPYIIDEILCFDRVVDYFTGLYKKDENYKLEKLGCVLYNVLSFLENKYFVQSFINAQIPFNIETTLLHVNAINNKYEKDASKSWCEASAIYFGDFIEPLDYWCEYFIVICSDYSDCPSFANLSTVEYIKKYYCGVPCTSLNGMCICESVNVLIIEFQNNNPKKCAMCKALKTIFHQLHQNVIKNTPRHEVCDSCYNCCKNNDVYCPHCMFQYYFF
jgi:hypothetical protein